eukprot:TRINITY_DN70907_c0_g1_i1.p2 TRINITY_DN70907_c0_g1~~TRINITY_DN70907_c0_g1_i1.p2  ORF type:complete len:100 (+),score=24.13 TRINITY_DN70907_c0_g1_i1:87-386(+)
MGHTEVLLFFVVAAFIKDHGCCFKPLQKHIVGWRGTIVARCASCCEGAAASESSSRMCDGPLYSVCRIIGGALGCHCSSLGIWQRQQVYVSTSWLGGSS